MGNIAAHEGELIRSAIAFDDLKAREIYTPRVQLTAIELGTSTKEIAQVFMESGFSRLPVYEDTIDRIVGILHLKDFYNANLSGQGKLEDWITPALFVSLNIKISRLMSMLKSHKTHMAIITDEYGGTVGIITLEDILEELVGDIWDEHDEVQSVLREIAPRTYLVDGFAEIDDVMASLGLLDASELIEDTTVAGWVMNTLEKIPVRGEGFTYHGYKVTVEEASRTHVDTVRIQRIQ